MLAVTDIAAEAIKSLTTDARLPAGGGLRISSAEPGPDQGGLHLELAPAPDSEDVVVATSGAEVFLEPDAAELLEEMVLDIEAAPAPDGGQELRFAIAPQRPPE